MASASLSYDASFAARCEGLNNGTIAALRSFNASEASLVQILRTSTSVRTGLVNHLDLTVAREAEHDELAARILALWRATARRYLSILDSLRDIY